METVYFSETLTCTDDSIWFQNPEEQHHQHHQHQHHPLHRRENLKSHKVSWLYLGGRRAQILEEGSWILCLRIFVVFLSPSARITEYYIHDPLIRIISLYAIVIMSPTHLMLYN
jgi:hypothetical protein